MLVPNLMTPVARFVGTAAAEARKGRTAMRAVKASMSVRGDMRNGEDEEGQQVSSYSFWRLPSRDKLHIGIRQVRYSLRGARTPVSPGRGHPGSEAVTIAEVRCWLCLLC